MLPIAYVETSPVSVQRDADRAEVRGRIPEKLFLRGHTISRAVARDTNTEDLLFAKIGQEQVAVIFVRQAVFVVTKRAGRRAAAEIMHHPESVGPPRHKII